MHIKIGKVEHRQVHAQAVEPLQSEVRDNQFIIKEGTNYLYIEDWYPVKTFL